jgi:hypothetical protein
MTFTLPGFKTVVRDGIVVNGPATVTVDALMTVGDLAETVMVSGQTSVPVDDQAATQRHVLPSALIADLPTGRTFQNLAILVPGVQMPLNLVDVGGSDGAAFQTLRVHGSRDDQMPLVINGMPFNSMNNTGGGYNHMLAVNTGAVQEMTVTTSGWTPEVRTSGVLVNTMAKEGSNQYRVSFYGDLTNNALQSNNLDDSLRARGLQSVNHVKQLFELNPTMGGPIVKDRLWFYGGVRYLRSEKYLAGSYDAKDPLSPVYCNQPAGCLFGYPTLGIPIGQATLVPDSRDLTKPDFSGDTYHRSYTGNLTWQINQKNKANFFYQLGERNYRLASSVTQTPEASADTQTAPDYLVQGNWTNPLSKAVLLEGGFTFLNETFAVRQRDGFGIPIGSGPGYPVAKVEASSGTLYGANFVNINARNRQFNMRFATTLVTRSHTVKVGVQDMWGTRDWSYQQNNSQFQILFNGAPVSLVQEAYPATSLEQLKAALGLFAQDKWTLSRLTFNLGVRFDYHNAYVPAQNIPAGPFIPAQHYDALTNTPNWKDLSPRFGMAWDVTGHGTTVARFNAGHFLASETVGTATASNPVWTRISQASRLWIDLNGNFKPDCDLTNRASNGECGALSAPLGDPSVVTHWDPSVLNGWGTRPSDNEVLVGLQQQLREGLALDLQWTRHTFGNLFATEYRATPPSAYDTFCVTAPIDPRLPGGGGHQLCGFTDLKPAYLGVTPDNFVTAASHFGTVADVYTGVDLLLTARFGHGGQAAGGVSTGRERTDFCRLAGLVQIGSPTDMSNGKIVLDNYVGNDIMNASPTASAYPSAIYCRVTPPYQPDWKGWVTYPLPWWDLRASATWQNRAGPQILASQLVAALDNTLGRPPTTSALTADLIAPGTLYERRLNQFDVRMAKSVRVGHGRIQGTVSVFNLLNANSILTLNTTYGPSWLTPTLVLPGRLVKFGTQVDF